MARLRRAKMLEGGQLTAPLLVSKVSAWLRLGLATNVSALSVPDVFASNPATQATAARKPTLGTSSNGLPQATFVRASANQLVWPIAGSAINGTSKWGFACWLKLVSNGAYHCLFNQSSGQTKVEIYIDSSRRIRVSKFGVDSSGYNGRDSLTAINSVPAVGTAFFLRYQFDGTQATEALRDKTFINEVDLSSGTTYSNVGTGGTPVTLRSASGNAIIGNYQDSSDATYALDAILGANAYVLNDSPTAAEGARLMAFEPLP